MTKFDMGRCNHDPAWTSKPHNSHCDKHVPAQNIERRVQWMTSKRSAK